MTRRRSRSCRLLEKTTNGFEIAEADLALRGPGDLLGTAQAGLPPLKLGSLVNDAELMRQARVAAFLLLERDPHLEDPAHRHFRPRARKEMVAGD